MINRLFSAVLITITFLLVAQPNYGENLYRATLVTKDYRKFDRAEARSLNQDGVVAGKFFSDDEPYDFYNSDKKKIYRYTSSHPTSYPIVNNHGLMTNLIYFVLGTSTLVYSDYYIYDPKGGGFESKGGFEFIGADYKGSFSTFQPNKAPLHHLRGFNDKGETLYNNDEDPLKVTASIFYTNEAPYLITGKYIGAINNNSEALVTDEDESLFNLWAKPKLKIVDSTNQEIAVVANQKLFGVAMNDRRDVIAFNADETEGFIWNETDGLLSLGAFIPVAMNNNADVVGKMHTALGSESPWWLRKSDGTMINLHEVVDYEELVFEEIISVTAINDKGQILMNAIVDNKIQPLLLNLIGK